MVAPRQLRKRHVVVQVLQRRHAGQYHVGMAGGFVQVDVHADHEVQRVQRFGQARAVGAGQHRIGSHGEQGTQLAGARGLNLFGEAGHGQLAVHLGCTAHAGMVAAGADALAHPRFVRRVAHRIGGKRSGFGKQHATLAVQVARQGIEHVHQPTRRGAVFLGAGADAGIDCGARCGGQRTRQAADALGRDAAARRHRLGCERSHRLMYFVYAAQPFGHSAGFHQLFGKQRVHHGGQQVHIGPGANEMVRVGHGGSFGAARVDHHQFAAARLQGFGLAAKVGHGPHAAVAHQWVGTQHQQVVGAGNVGQGDRKPVPEHQAAGQLLGHLVQRGGGKHILGAQRTGQLAEVSEQADFVG